MVRLRSAAYQTPWMVNFSRSASIGLLAASSCFASVQLLTDEKQLPVLRPATSTGRGGGKGRAEVRVRLREELPAVGEALAIDLHRV